MIRVRQTDDMQAVYEMDRKLFPVDTPLQDRELEGCHWWVATFNGEPVAYAGLFVGRRRAFILRIGVLAEGRGQGLSKRLIRAQEAFVAKQGLSKIWTYIAVTNLPSQRVFMGCGYRPYHYRKTPTNAFLYFRRSL